MTDAEQLAAAQARLDARRRRQGIAPIKGVLPRVVALAGMSPEASVGHEDDSDDALATLLPDHSEVVVGYVDERLLDMYHRKVWLVRLRILEGDQAGRLISWWLRRLDPARRVTRSSALATSYVAATGLRPPRDLARRRPSEWLADTQYRVRTRVVARDTHGVERVLAASYSVVEAIVERVAGIPPTLRQRIR